MMNIIKFLSFCSVLCFSFASCVNDSNSSAKANDKADIAAVDDHAGHDHSSHDHSGHDHSGHDHSGHDHSDHDHSGHDHSDHDHSGHSHTNSNQQSAQSQKFDKELAELEKMRGTANDKDIDAKKRAIEEARAKILRQDDRNKSKTDYTKVPNACQLVSDEFIAKTVGVNVQAINVKDGSSPASSHARACFFRWDHDGIPNSGVMIQIQTNPLPEEIPDWASYYIQAKLNSGDVKPDGSGTFKYKRLEGVGVTGAYNYDMHQYLFRTKDGKVVGVAFNLHDANEKKEIAWSKVLANEVIKNLRKK